jgi:trimeric autotransporter adhesin
MGRSVVMRCAAALVVLTFLAALAGCGSSSKTTNFPTPAGITLTPNASLSIDLGSTATFTAAAHNAANPPATLTVPIAFHSSNTAVVTIANNGLACAGTWNSLANPQICTPGPSGTAQITATSAGVSSPPTTVYVHQHIDSVSVDYVTPPTLPCESKGGILNFAARAFSHGADITSSVGQFSWQAVNPQVAGVSNSTTLGLPLNQAEATALLPGFTQIFATVAGVTSVPFPFTTCAVKSISLAVTGSTSTSYTVAQGTGKDITPTIIDTQGITITGVPLTWCSSSPTVALPGSSNCSSIATSTCTGGLQCVAVTSPRAGGASITASCTPPLCNVGFNPAMPIYPTNVITANITPTSGSTPSGTLYVTSTACPTTTNCAATAVVPVTFSGSTNTVGSPVGLPASPNSMVFGPQGTVFFMGTDLGLQGTKGLMRVDVSGATPSVNEFTSVTGKVLAVSPSGSKVIVSDTIQTPNQVFVFDNATNSSTPFQIPGATAAAFSVDGLKAFIVAGSKLYIYSTLNALQSQSLGFTGTDVTFLSEGAFGYVSGASNIGAWRTCDNQPAAPLIPTGGVPTIIRSVPNATQILAVDSPNIDVIDVTTTPTTCQPIVNNGPLASFNLGQGSFTAKQLFISPDGAQAYIIASDFPSVPVFSINNQTSSAIPLNGNVIPLAGALTSDGRRLYVTASDGMIHVLDTLLGSDIQQITFPPTSNLCAASDTTAISCPPDLITIKP